MVSASRPSGMGPSCVKTFRVGESHRNNAETTSLLKTRLSYRVLSSSYIGTIQSPLSAAFCLSPTALPGLAASHHTIGVLVKFYVMTDHAGFKRLVI